MNLKKIVEDEIKSREIPLNFKILVHPKKDNSYFVQISFDEKEIENHDCSHSYLDFLYNEEKNYIEHVQLEIREDFRGRSYGRKLIESFENIGRKLNCSKCSIYLNTNESLWEYFGYKKVGETWEKELL